MARHKQSVRNPSARGQNEDSKSMTSQVSGSQAQSQRGTSVKGTRKGAQTRGGAQSERSASKSRPQKDDLNVSQPSDSKAPSNIELNKSMSASQVNMADKIDQQKQIMMMKSYSNAPPQGMPRQIDARVAQSVQSSATIQGQPFQRVPTSLPPQITQADVNRAHSNIPHETELVEADIGGERVKASMKTIDYLKRFEGFLNKGPAEKLNFLNDKFFRKIPRDTGVFKTNRGKEVKCPV